jgi:hypothetical protein
MNATDYVIIRRLPRGQIHVSISTVATDAQVCEISGTAQQMNPKQLLLRRSTEEYDPSNGSYRPAMCRITIVSLDPQGKAIRVKSNGKCQNWCGMRASPEIKRAVRR